MNNEVPTEKLIEHARAAATVIERTGANKPLVDLLTALAARLDRLREVSDLVCDV